VVWPQTSSSRNIETLADQVTAPTALSRIRQNATSEAYALRPKAHERGKDGRDSLFRRFGVSAFRRFGVSAFRRSVFGEFRRLVFCAARS
jgi:hypothetical protein